MDKEMENSLTTLSSQNVSVDQNTASSLQEVAPVIESGAKQNTVKIVAGVLFFVFIVGACAFYFLVTKERRVSSKSVIPDTQKTESVDQGTPAQTNQSAASSSSEVVPSVANTLSLEDNAFFTLERIAKVIVSPADINISTTTIAKIASGEEWNEPAAREYLSKNKEALLLLSKASAQKGYQDPYYSKNSITLDEVPNKSMYNNISLTKKLQTLSNVEFEVALHDKDFRRAEEIIIERLAFSNLLLSAPLEGLSVAQGVGIRSGIISQLLPHLLVKEKLTASSSLAYEKLLSSYEMPSGSYAIFLDSEITNFKLGNGAMIGHALQELEKQGPTERVQVVLSAAEDSIFSIFLNGITSYRKENEKICTDINPIAVKNTINYDLLEMERSASPFIGKELVAYKGFEKTLTDMFTQSWLLYSAMDGYDFYRKCDDAVFFSSAKALIGIKAYKDVTGRLPESLQDLVPTYLSTLPLDPYSYSGPLGYSSTKGYIYSLGRDKINNGGSLEKGDWRKAKDPTFKLVD